MKAYLCLEKSASVADFNLPDEAQSRPAIYFVLKDKSEKEARDSANKLGAELIRELTDKEAETEAEDGSYDIEL